MELIPLLGYFYIVALVIGLTLFFIRKIPRVKPSDAILKLIDLYRPMIQSGLIAFGVFYAIIWLANKAACNLKNTAASSSSRYEPFASKNTQQQMLPPPGSPPSAYIPLVEAASDRMEANLDKMSELTSDICGIVKEIENAYVSVKSGDVDESEFSLPQEVQNIRRAARKVRATNIFAKNRSLFAKKSGTRMLECFQDAGDETETLDDEGETELQTVAQDLQLLLEDVEVMAEMNLFLPAMNALNFSAKYLDKAIDMQKEEGFASGSAAAAPSPPVESLTGPALIKAVEKLLQRENMFRLQLMMLSNSYIMVRARADAEYRKADKAERGDINSADVRSSLAERNVAVPT